jgi:hypothetical protein
MIQKLADYLFADAIRKGVEQYNYAVETFNLKAQNGTERTRDQSQQS